ncbi:Epididymal-Specific Lipocalin-10 [Manis pentadactyla]|nr:Epididymal-Specific Lipocalin-10 [Manis pentadactyla]
MTVHRHLASEIADRGVHSFRMVSNVRSFGKGKGKQGKETENNSFLFFAGSLFLLFFLYEIERFPIPLSLSISALLHPQNIAKVGFGPHYVTTSHPFGGLSLPCPTLLENKALRI